MTDKKCRTYFSHSTDKMDSCGAIISNRFVREHSKKSNIVKLSHIARPSAGAVSIFFLNYFHLIAKGLVAAIVLSAIPIYYIGDKLTETIVCNFPENEQ